MGLQRYGSVDVRVQVKGGGYTSQIYAIRQAIAKALVAFYQKRTSLFVRVFAAGGCASVWPGAKYRIFNHRDRRQGYSHLPLTKRVIYF
jgi:hypothetical protein